MNSVAVECEREQALHPSQEEHWAFCGKDFPSPLDNDCAVSLELAVALGFLSFQCLQGAYDAAKIRRMAAEIELRHRPKAVEFFH